MQYYVAVINILKVLIDIFKLIQYNWKSRKAKLKNWKLNILKIKNMKN